MVITILQIEDNSSDVRLVREHLTCDKNMLVVSADSLDAGLKILANPATAADLVLLDLYLPDSQGIETLYMLQREYPNTAVIVCSTLSAVETAEIAVRSGAQDYLVKGQFSGPELARSIRHAIARHARVSGVSSIKQINMTLIQATNRLRRSREDNDTNAMEMGIIRD